MEEEVKNNSSESDVRRAQGSNMMGQLDTADRKGKKVLVRNGEREDDQKMNMPLPPMEFISQRQRSTLVLDRAIEHELNHQPGVDLSNVDVRKLRRTISNRLSAQRSRQKKSCYLDALKKSADELQNRVAVLLIQVEAYQERNKELHRQRDSLQSLFQTRIIEANLREWAIQQTQEELNRLKEAGHASNSQLDKQRFQPYPGLQFYQRGLVKLEQETLDQEQQLPGVSPESTSATHQLSLLPPTLGNEQEQLPPVKGLPLQTEREVEEEEAQDFDRFIDYDAIDRCPSTWFQ